jgi:hypothetical protein
VTEDGVAARSAARQVRDAERAGGREPVSMDPVRRAPEDPASEAVEFVRFCYRRRRTGWPELYDEMCAVAGRGLYRGWTHEELAEHGIGFTLSQMPALAVLVRRVVEEEGHARGIDSADRRARPAADTVVREEVQTSPLGRAAIAAVA